MWINSNERNIYILTTTLRMTTQIKQRATFYTHCYAGFWLLTGKHVCECSTPYKWDNCVTAQFINKLYKSVDNG